MVVCNKMMTRLDLNQAKFSQKLIDLCKISCSFNLKGWMFWFQSKLNNLQYFNWQLFFRRWYKTQEKAFAHCSTLSVYESCKVSD